MSPNRGVGAKWPAFYSIKEQEMVQWWEHLSLWLRIKSLYWRHMWVEFVAGCLLCSERFFSRYSGFPLSSKINISNSSSTRDRVDCVDVLPLNHNLFIIFLFHVHDVTFFFTSGNSTGVLSSSPSSVSACGLCISP